METWMIVLSAGVSLLAGLGIAWVVIEQKRRRRSGTERHRAAKTTGGGMGMEADPASRARRFERLDIRPMLAGGHDRFADRWRRTQADFMNNSAGPARVAKTPVKGVMHARGYPAGDLDQRAAEMSVDRPRSVEHYGEAREAALTIQRGAGQAEDPGSAANTYRSRFEDLLETTSQLNIDVVEQDSHLQQGPRHLPPGDFRSVERLNR